MDTEVELRLILEDLHTWGAEELESFKERVGEVTTVQLLLVGLIKVKQGNTFTYVTLGGAGRTRLGLDPNYSVEPGAAAKHIMRREARAKLEQFGLRYVGAEDRVLRRFEDAEGKTYFLAVSDKGKSAGYTARAVRRLLSRYQELLLQTRGVLVVATAHAGRLSKMVSKHEGYLKTLEVDGRVLKAGTQRA